MTGHTELCVNDTPLCINDICTGCTKHTDCTESSTCLPSGACAKSEDVAYVGGVNATEDGRCTKDEPCTKIQEAAAKKSIVKVTGEVKEPCSITTGTVQIFADLDAKLTPTASDNTTALEARGTANIEIYDLQISKTTGNAPAITLSNTAKLSLIHVNIIENTGRGIDAIGGTLTITRSSISKNGGGGIRMSGPVNFHIVSNVIFGNGSPDQGQTSGLIIGVNVPSSEVPNELAFNSISRNTGNNDLGQGIQCPGANQVVIGSNNIIWNNGIIPGSGQLPPTDPQVNGTGCSHTFSDIGPIGVPPLTTNIGIDPSFVDEATGNLHLMPTSIAIQKADPSTNLSGLAAKDIDGDARVNTGTSMAADMGADQISKP